MAHVKPYTNNASAAVQGVFTRVTSEGDASRFYGAETGKSQVISIHTTALVNGLSRAYRGTDAASGLTYTDFVLDFEYIVAANQLEVRIGVYDPNADDPTKLVFQHLMSATERLAVIDTKKEDGGALFEAADLPSFYEEITPNSVRVWGADKQGSPFQIGLYLFSVPHTSIPAALRNKVTVEDQGDNEAVECKGHGDGVALRAPNGAKWLVRVDNSGVLIVEPR